MSFSMRMGMGLGAMQNSGGGATPAVWTIASTADGTNYVRIQCATTGQTLTAAGGAEIKLESDGEWGTSAVIPAGDTDRNIYYRGNGTGGTLTFPNPENITYLYLYNTDTSITGSITGMPLTRLHLYKTGTSITGSITGMELTYLYLYNTGTAITGNITGMPLTYLYLYGTGEYITGSITGMELTYLYLYKTGTSIDGVPPAIGKTLSTFRILGGDSYDYPWTEQTFALPARTWIATTMSIDCVAAAPTPAQFNTWLLGLASVSNPGTADLTLKNTPTIDELNAAGYGETDTDSGYYAMVTTLGYNLILGT
jgi:hypothetical protein